MPDRTHGGRTWVKEHVSDSGGLLVDLEWMAGQYYPLCDDALRIWVME
jgi:hypothetical protein